MEKKSSEVDYETYTILQEIVELGYINVQNNRITQFQKPLDNVFSNGTLISSDYFRWNSTLKYINDYIYYNDDFDGEYYVCLYDGFREGNSWCTEKDRVYVQWSSLTKEEKQRFIGQGSLGEPRFKQPEGKVYPLFNHKVLTYCRHINDEACLLIPDVEFIHTQFKQFTDQVDEYDIPFDEKTKECFWRGSSNDACCLRNDAVNSSYCNASFTGCSLKDQLKYAYLLDMDGCVSSWSGFYWKLYSNSIVLKTKSVWEQWYYDTLIPFVDFIPIDSLSEIPLVMQNDDTKTKKTKKTNSPFFSYEYAIREYKIH